MSVGPCSSIGWYCWLRARVQVAASCDGRECPSAGHAGGVIGARQRVACVARVRASGIALVARATHCAIRRCHRSSTAEVRIEAAHRLRPIPCSAIDAVPRRSAIAQEITSIACDCGHRPTAPYHPTAISCHMLIRPPTIRHRTQIRALPQRTCH